MVPSRIGKYEVIAPIGRGSMGEVVKARDTVIGRFVALKTMSAALSAIPELRQRFHREAQSAGSLSHSNIVTVYDFGEDRGQAYLAMELLDGRDLKDLIGRQEPMTLGTRLGLMEQICDGLAFAHAREVVHRDLKPANIHVLPGGHVKIMDFGLARLSSSNMTQAGVLMGTPHYMSPEQVRGEKADTRSDVFSLGVVFYELLANRRPFDADSMHSVLLQVINHEPEPLGRVVPGLPPRLAEILETALAKDPARRFRDAGAMRQALRAVRAGLTAETWPATTAVAAPERNGTTVVQADLATVRVPLAGAALRAAALGRLREEGAARDPGRGWREPAMAGAALLTLAALLLVVPVGRIGGAAVRLTASPASVAAAEPIRLLNAIASSLPAAPAIPSLRARHAEVAPVVARVEAALDKGDAASASRELDGLLALDPGHPALPALAARLEGLLMARLEQASVDLAEAHEARARQAQARERAAAQPASLRPRRATAPSALAAPVPPPPGAVSPEAPPASARALIPTLPADPLSQDEVIRRVVKELEQALEEGDVKKLRTLTPDLTLAEEKAIARSPRPDVSVAITGLKIEGPRATVDVLWSHRSRDGTVSTVRRILGMERSVSGWKVAAVLR